MFDEEIEYKRESPLIYRYGELMGYADTYLQAEASLNQLVYELLKEK